MTNGVTKLEVLCVGAIIGLLVTIAAVLADSFPASSAATHPADGIRPLVNLSFDDAEVVEADPAWSDIEGEAGDGVTHWRRTKVIGAHDAGSIGVSRRLEMRFPVGTFETDTEVSVDVWMRKSGGDIQWVVFELHPAQQQVQSRIRLEVHATLARTLAPDSDCGLWSLDSATEVWGLADVGFFDDQVGFNLVSGDRIGLTGIVGHYNIIRK